jgi:WD40 repeat protein
MLWRSSRKINKGALVAVITVAASVHCPLAAAQGNQPAGPQNFVLESGHESGLKVTIRPDGKLIAVGEGPIVTIFDVEKKKELSRFSTTSDVTAFAYGLDGHKLAAGTASGLISLWVDGEQEAHTLLKHKVSVASLAFTADGKQLLSAGVNGTVVRWDLGTGQAIKAVGHPIGEDDEMEAIALSDGTTWLADCSGVP